MCPYPGKNITEAQTVFNYRLSRARRVMENAFGIHAARWRISKESISAKVENVETYVLAVLCLHNYLRQTDNAGYCLVGFVDSEDSSGQIKQDEWRSSVATGNGCFIDVKRKNNSKYKTSAKVLSEALTDYLNSGS